MSTPLPKVLSSRRIVFDATILASGLTSHSTIGELNEYLIALCLSAPEYLDARDSSRYASFLHELNQFETPVSWERDSPIAATAKLPLRSLHRILEDWVFSYFRNGSSGLLPHYALDTVSFMEATVQGSYSHEPEPWELKSVFGRDIAELGLFRFLDSQFKKRFTELIDLELIAKVPEGASIVYRDETVLGSGADFVFHVRRCHLSENFYEGSLFEIKEEVSRPKFDLTGDFRLKGYIIPQDEARRAYSQGFALDLPIRWVTHEAHYDEKRRELFFVPIPDWLLFTSRAANCDVPR